MKLACGKFVDLPTHYYTTSIPEIYINLRFSDTNVVLPLIFTTQASLKTFLEILFILIRIWKKKKIYSSQSTILFLCKRKICFFYYIWRWTWFWTVRKIPFKIHVSGKKIFVLFCFNAENNFQHLHLKINASMVAKNLTQQFVYSSAA